MNHHPVIRGIRLCGDRTTGTADSFAPITCPHCRAKLEAKAAAHEETARNSKGAEKRFFAADAARVRRGLAA
jgi:hypothetical protein